MAHRRPSPHRVHSTSVSSPLPRRKYPLRRSPHPRNQLKTGAPISSASSQGSPTTLSTDGRPVLVPLHPNLRRLPSRLVLAQKDEEMRDLSRPNFSVQVGSKRKRVASSNENAHVNGRPSRVNGRRLKRLKSSSSSRMDYTSDEGSSSSMDVDSVPPWSSSLETEVDAEEDEEESTDDYLLFNAPTSELQRLRKDNLIRLYYLAGLADDPDNLTKSELVDGIVSERDQRDELASLPPSSPTGRSEYSSDEGNTIDTEDDAALLATPRPGPSAFSLRRRATTNEVSRSAGRPAKSRSLSMGHLLENPAVAGISRKSGTRFPIHGNEHGAHRRRNSRTSPTGSASAACSSPLVSRLRSRKLSAPTAVSTDSSSLPSSRGRSHSNRSSKSKGKQVEFSDAISRSPDDSPVAHASPLMEESDLTELDSTDSDEAGPSTSGSNPSPRRLRNRVVSPPSQADSHDSRRVIPMRKAKRQIRTLEEEDDVDELDEEGGESVEEVDEVDELVSTVSVSPVPSTRGRTPVKNRLRSRNPPHSLVSDGDDEADDEDDEEEGGGDDELAGDEDEQSEGSVEEDDEADIADQPRVLRNGKIVGEEDAEMVEEEDIVSESEEDAAVSADEQEEEEEEEGAEEDEAMEQEDVDLDAATAKSLVRLRRDDLVRLCEDRDLDPIGTKPQLAEALLQWRDRRNSSPSSTGTIRPPSTTKRRRGRRGSPGDETPVLERSHRFHMDEPVTPPVSEPHKETNAAEPELELDLGTLGLEDREIPPEKIQKLEKIGSGGFKDVFIGKFRGRKIAISEFRGQLNAMDIKELKLLGGFDHPNIVRFLGVSIPETTSHQTPVMIISELCANGDLFDYVRNVNPPSLNKILSIMLDIARGLEYLHLRKPSVIHRDCKSSNILITSKGTAKIADFGLAKVKQSTRSMVRSLVGTVNWQAPELWHPHPKYNHKVDVFSCAMVYWEMLQWHLENKKFPWEGMNEHAIYDIVGAKRQRPSIAGLRKQWCPEVVDLIEKMWAHNHQDRPTISEVVQTLEDLLAAR